MSDTYEVDVKIKSDSSEAESAFGRIGDGLSDWGINLDKMYEKGDGAFKNLGINVDQLGSKVGIGGQQLVSMAALVAVAVEAIKKLAEFVAECTKAFAEDETAQLKFNAAIASNSQLTGDASNKLMEFAESFSKLSGQTISATQSQMAMLSATGRTQEQIEGVMKAAQGLANATGTDLQTAITQINQTFSGAIGRLGKMTPALKDLSKEELENGDAVKVLVEKYGSFSDTLKNSSDVSMKNYTNSVHELQSSFGKLFEEAIKPIRDALTSINLKLTETVTHFTNLHDAQEKIAKGTATIDDYSVAISDCDQKIRAFNNQQKDFVAQNGVQNGSIQRTIDRLSKQRNGYIDNKEALESALSRQKESADEDNKGASAKAKLAEAQKKIKDVTDEYNKSISDTQKLLSAGLITSEEAHKQEKDATQKAAETLATLGATGTQSYKNIKASLDSYTSSVGVSDEVIQKYRGEADAAYLKQITAEVEASKKATEQAIKDKEKEADYELKWADKAVASSAKVADKKKDYSNQILQDQLKTIDKQEDAEKKQAALTIKDEKKLTNTLEDIHKSYTNEKNSLVADAKQKELAAGQTLGAAWTNYYNNLTSQATNWNGTISTMATTMGTVISGAFETMGKALVEGKATWKDFGKSALESLAKILDAIGEQLAALAAVSLVEWNWGDAAIAAAGAAAAFVASGVVSGWADSMTSTGWAATGTDYSQAGYYRVGELGPETVYLPQGSSVANASETASGTGRANSSSTTTNNITITSNKSSANDIARALKRTNQQLAYASNT